MRNSLFLFICAFCAVGSASCDGGDPDSDGVASQSGVSQPIRPVIASGEPVGRACIVSAPVGSIPVVMPDGSLGASPLQIIDNFVYSSGTIIVVLKGDGVVDAALRAAVAGGEYGLYTANSIFSSSKLTAVSASIATGLTANSLRSDTFVSAAGAVYAGSVSASGSVKTEFLYSDSALISGGLTVSSVTRTQAPASGWVDCPEEGECACPDGQRVAKTENRGARIYCVAN